MLKNLFIGIILSSLLVAACGSSDGESASEDDGPKYFEIINSDKSYTMDDVMAAGLKGVKEFKTCLLYTSDAADE